MSVAKQTPLDISSEDESSVTLESLVEECSKSIDGIIQEKTSADVRELSSFLLESGTVAEKGDPATTICNVAFGRNYAMTSPVHIERLFDLLEACRLACMTMHFTERQYSKTVNYSGIMLDFDIIQPVPESQLAPSVLTGLVRRVCAVLFNTLDFTETICHVFIIRKPAPVLLPQGDTKIYKDGIHILIPDVWITKPHKEYLAKVLQEGSAVKTALGSLVLSTPPEQTLDLGSVRNPVFFFSHSKTRRGGAPPPAYFLDSAYEVSARIEDDMLDMDVTALSVDNLRGVSTAPISKRPTERGQKINLIYELSLTFSMVNIGVEQTWLVKRQYLHKTTLDTKIKFIEDRADASIDAPHGDEPQQKLDELITNSVEARYLMDLLSILDISYATDYLKWFKVLCAIAYTNVAYKPLAVWFSMRSPEKFSAQAFREKWREAKRARGSPNPLTKRSIVFWAKESSPERFRALQKTNYVAILLTHAYENDGRIEHAMIAKIINSMWSDRFVVDVMKNEQTKRVDYSWYEFVTPGVSHMDGQIWKWRQEFQPDSIHTLMSDELPKLYVEVEAIIKNRRDNAADGAAAKFHAEVLKVFKKSKSNLSNDMYQNATVKQARYRFRDRNFAESLDNYPDYIGVGNGIVHIGREPELICTHHELKISKFTKVNYVPFDPANPYIITLLRAVREIYIEPDVFEFMMCFASTAVDGNTKPPILVGKQGGGQNGKTFCAVLTQEVVGDMYSKVQAPTLLTSAREQANQANEAMMALKDTRYNYFDEFNDGDSLNEARVKSIVNPAKVSTRGNYGSQEMLKCTFTLEFLTNHFLQLRSTDHGIWRRIYMYTCKMKFCPNPDPNNPFEKKEDTRFIMEFVKLKEYKEAWLSILVYWYKKLQLFYGGKIAAVPCPTIVRETEIYRNKQDMINCFITTHMVKSPASDRMSLDGLVGRYSEWYTRRTRAQAGTHENIKSQFENSRLAKEFVTEDGVNKYLGGYRVRINLDEPLQPGETSLTAVQAAEERAMPPTTFNIYDWLIPGMGGRPEFGEVLAPTRPVGGPGDDEAAIEAMLG